MNIDHTYATDFMRTLVKILCCRKSLIRLSLVLVSVSWNRVLAEEVIDIGNRRELFVDRLLIEELDECELRLHPPVKQPRANSPLPVRHMMTVIKDKDSYQAYYRGSLATYEGPFYSGHPGELVQYAESKDGHEWTFPEFDFYSVDEISPNNVILAHEPPFLTNFSPFLDRRPGVSQNEKYKALAGHPGPGDKRGLKAEGKGLYSFYSADGVHWNKEQEVIPYQPEWRHAFDSQNVSFWSEAEQLYVCYFRTWTSPERLRSISRTTSVDFVHWSKPVEMSPNLPNEHLYTNQTHPYYRAPHIYISLPTRFIPNRGDSPDYDRKDVNATDVLFMSTRAGSTYYDRTFTEAFIRPGLDPGRWKNRANYVALNVLPTGPQEMSIYHRSGDRFTLRPDGFISIHTGSKTGEFLSKPISFNGSQIEVNFSTSAAGSIQLEIQDINRNLIPGFSLEDCPLHYGDEIDGIITWSSQENLASLSEQPIRLRFVMKECDLYSFRFRE